MPIDLTVVFIYNYCGVNSGIIFPKAAAKFVQKQKFT